MSEQFSRILFTDEKGDQWRLTVSDFRDKEYLHIRKYYQDMEGEYQPTKTGASFVLSIDNSYSLLFALAELLSNAELGDISVDSMLRQILLEYEERNATRLSEESLRSLLLGPSNN